MAEKRALEAAKAKAKAADDDATAVIVNCCRKNMRERRRHKCRN